MSAVCLHTRALRAIEQRLDALLQAGEGFPINMEGWYGKGYFRVEATADYSAARGKDSTGAYYTCKSSGAAIKAFFDRISANAEYNKGWRDHESIILCYSLTETRDTIKMLICGEACEFLEFTKPYNTWVDRTNNMES
jgi:hypothetical protein